MKNLKDFSCIMYLYAVVFIMLIVSACSEVDEKKTGFDNGKLVPVTIKVGGIIEDITETRNLSSPISFIKEIGEGYFMETSIVPENSIQTRVQVGLVNGVICRMLVYRNNISSANYYKTVEFRVGEPIVLELPANSSFKLVCYSYNSKTDVPEFSLSDGNVVDDIILETKSDGSVNDLLRSEGGITTSDSGGSYAINFKHVFSRVKLILGTSIIGQQITSCTAHIKPVITGATFSPSAGTVVKDNTTTSVLFNFPTTTMNNAEIESDFIDIIAPNRRTNIIIDKISIRDSQNPNLLDFINKSFTLPIIFSSGKSYHVVQNIRAGAIVYKSNDHLGGDVIMPEGKTINFTFYNPLNDNFQLQAYETKEGAITPIVATASSTNAVKSITIPSHNSVLGSRIIRFRYYNEATAKWYETGVEMTQRGASTINVMTMGQVQIYNARSELTNPTTYLNLKHAYNGYSAGLRPLLENKVLFGPSGKVPYTFKFFNLFNVDGTEYQVGRNYDLRSGNTMIKSTKQVLEENKIDILCVFWDWAQTPTPDQVKQMLDWLAADSHRGLIFTFDYYKYYGESATKVGTEFRSFTNSSHHWLLDGLKLSDNGLSGHGGGTANFHLLSPGNIGYDNIEYKKIVDDGAFGSIRRSPFRAIDNDYGWITQSLANREGYIPILLDANNRVVVGLHPEKRIFFHGELQFLEAGAMGPYGDVNYTSGYGAYAKLMGNLWAWFVERIVMGEKYN